MESFGWKWDIPEVPGRGWRNCPLSIAWPWLGKKKNPVPVMRYRMSYSQNDVLARKELPF